ncbi:MAG: gliding motility-associated C-terminal domain-containing protein, partial [Flavobacteriales bacterium]|nr:gliding motility-associated C-terminal domain-containing protein [Flavobacteriales bacterium]MCW8914152.1 gliding motility-associated C-terminal domain-containing protein [Flavobacteriales bacterium]MCW8938978.1 gliding motility-associated C-terminal domain-containing protein [Flavobacteriales bacterium]MCW8940239.1 gliding motility-associated C-terminal domain-containing protein [Flavobacteriales bacterium]MCW8969485.1 gliding motility-associated C-terminal domain-containing protein [Flavob
LPTITASNDTTICDGACAQLNATGGTSYSWSPSTGLSDSTIANPTACVTSQTTYVVTGTDANSCVNTDTVTVSINPLPTITASPDVWVCLGDSAQIFANGGTSYTWSPTSGLSNPNISNPMAAPANTITYVVTGTDINGCSNTDSVVVTANDTVPISLANDTTICVGDSVQLGGNPTSVPGTSFSWSPAASLNNATSANPIAFPTVTTTYYVTATNDTCSTTDSITITVHPISNISAGNDLSMCFGDTVQLSASGGASYVWSPGNSLSDSTIFNPLAFPTATTSYIVNVLDTNGCNNSDTVLVTVNPLPTINAGNDVSICDGDTAQLQATGASSYLWTPSAGLSDTTIANPLAFPTVTTSYVVTGTDTNSCSNTDTVVVNVNALPTITAFSDTAVCSGVSVQLNATGGSAYTWVPAATLNNANIPNPIASPITTTTYQVTGVDTNGCSNVDSVTITINALPTINAGTDVAICIGDTAQLQASGGNGYLWTPSAGLSDTTIANPLAFPTVTTTYIVMGTDTNACEGTDTIVVTVNPLPTISAGLTDTVYICNGDSVQLNATGGTSYVWTPNTNITNNTIANPFVFPPVTTTYYVTGTDGNTCSNSDSVVVSVFAIPNLTDTVLCVGDSIQLTAYGPPGATYTWTPPTDLSNPNISNPYTSTTVTITYTVTVQDTNSCIDTTQITVTAEDKPNAAFTVETTPACDGILAVFDNTSTGADSYLWLFGDGSQSNETHPTYIFSYGASFTTILNAYSTNGCLDTASFNISSLSFEEQFNLTPPSVLTPNRDGHNDEFKLDLPEAISACTNIEIFNRWGMKMFESKGQNIGWDGRTTAGEEVPDGTYFYIVDVKGIIKKGSITLMR